MQRLSRVERAVLVLYHQEERTYEQIALALGLPLGTVRTHLHRGRKKLREGIAAAQAEGHCNCSKGGRMQSERMNDGGFDGCAADARVGAEACGGCAGRFCGAGSAAGSGAQGGLAPAALVWAGGDVGWDGHAGGGRDGSGNALDRSRTMFGTTLEWILCAELVALAAWLGGVWKPMES